MKSIKWIVIFGILLAGVGYIAMGPYRTVDALKAAVIANDTVALSGTVDFSALKKNLKEQVNTAVIKESKAKIGDNSVVKFMAGMTASLTDGIVDKYTAPGGLGNLMAGKKPSKLSKTGGETPAIEELLKDPKYTYDSMEQCSVWINTESGGETQFVFKRSGISWKLVNIVIAEEDVL